MKRYLFILGFLLCASATIVFSIPAFATGFPNQLDSSHNFTVPDYYNFSLGTGNTGVTSGFSMYFSPYDTGGGYRCWVDSISLVDDTNSGSTGGSIDLPSGYYSSPQLVNVTLSTPVTFNSSDSYSIHTTWDCNNNQILGDSSSHPYINFVSSAPPSPSTLLISSPSFVGDSWSLNLYNPGSYDLYSNYIGVTYATTSDFSSEQYNDYKSLSSYSGATNTAEEIDNIIIPQTALLLNTSTTYYAMPWIYFNGSYIDGTTTTFNVGSNYVPPSQSFLTNATGTLGPYSWGAGLYSTSSPNAIVNVTQLATTTCDGYLDLPCELGNWSSGVFNFLFGIDPSTIEFISGISLTRTAPFNIIGEIQSDFASSSSTAVQALATTTLTFNLKGSATSSAVGFEIFGSNLLHEYISDNLAALFRSIILTVLTVGMVYGFYRQILSLAKTNTT